MNENSQSNNDSEKSLPLKEIIKILLKSSRAYWMVNIVNLGDGVAYFGILTLLTLFISNRIGLSDHGTGLSLSLFVGGVTLFMLGGGFITDRFGVRKALSISLLILLIGRSMLVSSPWLGSAATGMLWSSLLIMALAEGIIQPALYAGVKEFTDPRTATIGYSALYSIMNLGMFLGEFSSPLVREQYGIDGVYYLFTGFTLLVLVVNLFGFTKRVEVRDRVLEPEKKDKLQDDRTLLQKIKALPFLDIRFIFFIFILLPVRTLFAHQWYTMPQYVERCYPAEVFARFEWFQSINPLTIVIFVPLFAALTRKKSVLTMMIIGTSVTAVAPLLLVSGPNMGLLIMYMVLFSLGEALWSSRFLEYVADLAPAGKVGAYMGIAGIPWFLAKTTTGFYSGLMLEKFIPASGPTDSSTLWFIYALIACISPIGLLLGRKWVERGVPEKAA